MPKINESKTEMIGIGHYLREYPERSFKSNKKR